MTSHKIFSSTKKVMTTDDIVIAFVTTPAASSQAALTQGDDGDDTNSLTKKHKFISSAAWGAALHPIFYRKTEHEFSFGSLICSIIAPF